MRPLPVDALAALHAQSTGKIDTTQRPIQLGCPGPWRVGVASIIAHGLDTNLVADPIAVIFEEFPRPKMLGFATWTSVSEFMRGIPRCNRRARNIVKFSKRWFEGKWTDVRDLPGVNSYVADCVGLFCFSDTDIESADPGLIDYIKESKCQGRSSS